MEMNMKKKSDVNIPVAGGTNNVATKARLMTPAVLGMPTAHGVKFPTNMTSECKKELLSKLEEWRKARKEKLAASILAKQKQASASAFIKSKPISVGEEKGLKKKIDKQDKDRQSVFERLYKNNGRMKKLEISVNSNKPQQISKINSQKSALLTFDKSSKPIKDSLAENVSETLCMTIDPEPVTKNAPELLSSGETFGNSLINSIGTAIKEEAMNENSTSAEVDKENSNEEAQVGFGPDDDRIQISGENSIKAAPVLKTFSIPQIPPFEPKNGKNVLRRSISMMFREKKRSEFAVRRCLSAKNLNELNFNVPRGGYKTLQTLRQSNCDNEKKSKKEAASKSITFLTPRNIKPLTSSQLRTNLEDWLKVKGHSLDGYRHLRCFGVSNKGKSPRTRSPDDSFGKSHLGSTSGELLIDSDKENVTPPTVVRQVNVKDAENWLKELHRLIVELKYPPERCEEWLAAIRRKCATCSQLPIYWECLAALHETKGDLKSAIEDYERVIIKGGEVDAVGDSLAQLFDKMVIEQKKCSKPKLEKGLDPKNIFKSTIIKFALQQKAIKKLSSEIDPGVREQLYVATPVRRSTRIQTPFRVSEEVASLRSLTPELRKNLTFKPNESLL